MTQRETETRAMLEEAWLRIHHEGYPPENEEDTCRKCDAFYALLDINTDEAFLAAAMMLLPEGWVGYVGIGSGPVWACLQNRDDNPTREAEADASTPAQALLAAIIKARSDQDGTD